ncbi:hypothetical protein J2W39_003650 [Variovorax paradoxus]|uniref:PIN domain-containing protein n=1 Tax=Variovorax paradoxus TaxID=34073 RepID=A0AAW8EHC4_VARPD|nr:hypothetical protein [Variovorax paradoxus]
MRFVVDTHLLVAVITSAGLPRQLMDVKIVERSCS